jgi:hypothetical protein
MAHAKPYYITPAFAFVAYPNRDSTPFKEWYGIPEAETVVRGTLRYQGFPEFIKALVDIGFLSAEEKGWLKEGRLSGGRLRRGLLGLRVAIRGEWFDPSVYFIGTSNEC